MTGSGEEAAVEAAAKIRMAQVLRQTAFPKQALDELWHARTEVEREAFRACVQEIIDAHEQALQASGWRPPESGWRIADENLIDPSKPATKENMRAIPHSIDAEEEEG